MHMCVYVCVCRRSNHILNISYVGACVCVRARTRIWMSVSRCFNTINIHARRSAFVLVFLFVLWFTGVGEFGEEVDTVLA